MLFVLRQDAEEPWVELVLGNGTRASGTAAMGDLRERDEQRLDLGRSIGAAAALGGEEEAVELHGAKDGGEHALREVDAAEPQVVEHLFELV